MVDENVRKWLNLVEDISVDYDGFNDAESLKSLIDEMRGYVSNALDNKPYNMEDEV